MKTFLEEYGTIIIIAIVVVLLVIIGIALRDPIQNGIDSLVSQFSNKAGGTMNNVVVPNE